MAELALHQCVKLAYKTNEEGTSKISEIHYSYEFLDDFITPKPTLNAVMSDLLVWNPKSTPDEEEAVRPTDNAYDDIALKTIQYTQHTDDENQMNKSMFECEDEKYWMQEKYNQANHPLELMVSA